MNVIILTLVMLSGHMPIKKMVVSPILQQELGLKENQINQIRNVWFEGREKLIDLNTKRQKLLLNIQKELTRDSVNLEKLRKLYSELGNVISKLRFAKTEMMVKVRNVLTKDQLMRLEEMKHAWRNRREKGMMNRPDWGPMQRQKRMQKAHRE